MLSMTLKINDKFKIEGESTLAGYENSIDVDHLEHGLRMPMVGDKSSNSRTAGKCVHGALMCTMRLNKAYPKLVEACVKGNSLGKVEVHAVKMAGGKIAEVLSYSLSDVYVASVNIVTTEAGAGAEERGVLPLIKVALDYQGMDITAFQFNHTGEKVGSVSCVGMTGTGGAA